MTAFQLQWVQVIADPELRELLEVEMNSDCIIAVFSPL